jgi:hypothetical protein
MNHRDDKNSYENFTHHDVAVGTLPNNGKQTETKHLHHRDHDHQSGHYIVTVDNGDEEEEEDLYCDEVATTNGDEVLTICSTVTAPEVTHWTEIMSQGWTGDSPGVNTTAWDTVLSDLDLQQIEQYWDRLMPTVSYLGTDQVAKVYQALCVAYRAHRGQMRKSGEPFIVHPVEVALLLSGLKMDGETVRKSHTDSMHRAQTDRLSTLDTACGQYILHITHSNTNFVFRFHSYQGPASCTTRWRIRI